MINGIRAQRVFESFCNRRSTFRGRTGPRGFVEMIRHDLGLTTDEYGRRRVRDTLEDQSSRARPEEFNLCELAEAMLGREFIGLLRDGGDGGLEVLEAAEGAVVPGHFPNISAYSATVGNLLEVKVLEGYQRPLFVADQLVRTIPTRLRSEKLPGISSLGDQAETMTPGQAHPRVQLQERYVETPETQKRGAAIDVTKEAAFFDVTNQLLAQAEAIGQTLGLRKEKLVLDTVLGIANTYKYRGTSYDTYLTAGNWVNDHVNVLSDWTDLDAARQLAAEMTDQETGERILVMLDTILVMPFKEETARYILDATEVEQRTGSAAEVRRGPNRERGRYNVVSSPIAYQRLTDGDGANLSATEARDRWFLLEARGAFGYMENWSMQTQRASAGDYIMADHGLILSVFVDEMGTPAVLEPRKTIRNKQA